MDGARSAGLFICCDDAIPKESRQAPTWNALNGKHVGMLFEKPSLRTRVTMTIGVRELGGDIVEIPADVMHADREPVNDVARNLERWVDAVVIRTFAQERLHQIAEITPKLHIVGDQAGEVSRNGAGLTEFTDPKAAVRDVDAIYTDVWTSMGQEMEYAERKKTFKRYQVTETVRKSAMK